MRKPRGGGSPEGQAALPLRVGGGESVLALGLGEGRSAVEGLEFFDVHPSQSLLLEPRQQRSHLIVADVGGGVPGQEAAPVLVHHIGSGAREGEDHGAAVGDHLQPKSRAFGRRLNLRPELLGLQRRLHEHVDAHHLALGR